MQTLHSRPGGVYRSERSKALYASIDLADADYGEMSIARAFAAIAEEIGFGSLCAMQALTLVVAFVSVILLSKTSQWTDFIAVGLTTAFLAVAASVGGYLISIKTSSGGKGS